MDESTLQKIIAEEKEYGVDYKKIEKKYIFAFESENEGEMEIENHQTHNKVERTVTNEFTSSNNSSNDKLESSYISQRFITPSQHNAMSLQDELRLRNISAELITEACFSLKLPWYTVISAQSLFHRFYYRVSFLDYDIKDSIMACIFLATKVEESPRKIRDVVTVFNHVLKVKQGRQDPIAVIDPASEYYQYLKQLVIDCERYVLKELGFELYRLTEHPHSYLLDYLKRLKSSKEVAKKAWNYLNDSYRSTLCVHYPPHILATSCLYLAIWSTKTPMPKTIWWAIFDTSIKHILEVCAEILNLYELPKTEMKDVKEILDTCYKANNLQKEYYVNTEEFFNLQKKARHEPEKKEDVREDRTNPRRKDSHRSPRYSKDRNGYRGERRYDSRDRRNRSPRRRDRTRSREKGRRKYSRSPSSDRDGRSRKRDKMRSKDKYAGSSSERSSPEKRKRSPSEHKKKKKRDKSKERKKEKERERERDKDRDDKSHKNKKEDKYKDKDKEKEKHREKHKDRDTDKKKNKEKDRERDKEREKTKTAEKDENLSKEERKASVIIEEKKSSQPLDESLLALKQELLNKIKNTVSTSHHISEKTKEPKEKINEEQPEDKAQSASDSDEDDEKLAALKKKNFGKQKEGKVENESKDSRREP